MSTVFCIPDCSAQSFPVTEEYIEKKSRFLTSLFFVENRSEAEGFLQDVRNVYSDANHHCFAWVIGNPNNPQFSQCGDDGEPSGTAGRPILGVLTGGSESGYGYTLLVVSRYFGGIKLGAGGLVRAYSAAARAVIEKTTCIEFVPKTPISISFAYPFEREIRYICKQLEGSITAQEYQHKVSFLIEIGEQSVEELRSRLLSCTGGNITINTVTDEGSVFPSPI